MRRSIGSVLATALVLVGAPLLLLGVSGCGDSDEPAAASQSEFTARGRYGVATRDFVFVDTTRPTQPNGSYAGAPERTLPARVWYPTSPAADRQGTPVRNGGAAASTESVASDGPFPIIGYAHGFLSSRIEAADLKVHLASHGYVVIAPDFPLSNGTAPGGPTFGDLGNQPADLAFVMDAVAAMDGENADLARAVDSSRRGIMGLSLGGGTTLIGAFHPVLHLDRIQAAVASAPVACFFGAAFYAHALPTVLLAGSADELVPLATGPGRAFEFAPPPVILVNLLGGNHLGFTGLDLPGDENSDEIGCKAVAAAIANGDAGIDQLTRKLTENASPDVVDPSSCNRGVCEQRFLQTMGGARQLELAGVAALAHFEAVLRGRADAARFLTEAFAANNPEVEVSVKP